MRPLAALMCVTLLLGPALPRHAGADAPAPSAPESTSDALRLAHGIALAQMSTLSAYAQRADADGYTTLASLFRAHARASKVHADVLGAELKKLGAPAGEAGPAVSVGTTLENLQGAQALALRLKNEVLPALRERASKDKNRDADRALRYMRESTVDFARFYEQASDAPAQWRQGKRAFYVHRVCGYMIDKLDITKCPVCYGPREEFEKVE